MNSLQYVYTWKLCLVFDLWYMLDLRKGLKGGVKYTLFDFVITQQYSQVAP